MMHYLPPVTRSLLPLLWLYQNGSEMKGLVGWEQQMRAGMPPGKRDNHCHT